MPVAAHAVVNQLTERGEVRSAPGAQLIICEWNMGETIKTKNRSHSENNYDGPLFSLDHAESEDTITSSHKFTV